jgi:hypothetical protein
MYRIRQLCQCTVPSQDRRGVTVGPRCYTYGAHMPIPFDAAPTTMKPRTLTAMPGSRERKRKANAPKRR